MLVDRRDFVRWCTVLCATHLVGAARRTRIQLWFSPLGSGARGGFSPMQSGALMGIEEAMRAAALFGDEVSVRDPRAGDEVMPSNAVMVWIVDDTIGDRREQTLDLARRTNAIVIDTSEPADALQAQCNRHVFFASPGAAARRAALAGSSSGATEVALWDSRLTRFGADTLNKRYSSRGVGPMTGPAWCGWFAVKCVWEATLQSKASSAAGIIAWMERPATKFDGHKGSPLRFNARHELVQPVYLLQGGKIVDEVVVDGSSGSPACEWKD